MIASLRFRRLLRPAMTILIGTSLLLAATRASAGVVISNRGLQLSIDEVRQLYSGELGSKDGTPLLPVDNAIEQGNFIVHVLGIDAVQYQNRWTLKSFRKAITPPPVNGGDAEVIAYVKRMPGGVGYLRGTAPADVSTIAAY
jgi:hypothetical protein